MNKTKRCLYANVGSLYLLFSQSKLMTNRMHWDHGIKAMWALARKNARRPAAADCLHSSYFTRGKEGMNREPIAQRPSCHVHTGKQNLEENAG